MRCSPAPHYTLHNHGETVATWASTLGTRAISSSDPSGRHLDVWTSSVEAVFLQGLTTQTDGSAVTALHVLRMFRTTWPTLLLVCCWNQSSQCKSRRSGRGSFLPTPLGRTSNHHSSDSDSSDMLKKRRTARRASGGLETKELKNLET